MEKKLYRSRTDKAFSGVCAGVAAYLDIDVIIVRLLTVILALMSFGTVLVIYIIASLVIPEEPYMNMGSGAYRQTYETTYQYTGGTQYTESPVYTENAGEEGSAGETAEAAGAASAESGNAAPGTGAAAGMAHATSDATMPGAGTPNYTTAAIPDMTYTANMSGTGAPNAADPAGNEPGRTKKSSGAWVIGILLIGIGLYMILDFLFPWVSWRIFGAVLLIVLGLIILIKR